MARLATSVLLAAVVAVGATSSVQAAGKPQAPKTGRLSLPRMQLQEEYAGPMQDTLIQRWRDPADGTICYIYLPVIVQHSPPTPSGFVQYGSNGIGSISCMPPH